MAVGVPVHTPQADLSLHDQLLTTQIAAETARKEMYQLKCVLINQQLQHAGISPMQSSDDEHTVTDKMQRMAVSYKAMGEEAGYKRVARVSGVAPRSDGEAVCGYQTRVRAELRELKRKADAVDDVDDMLCDKRTHNRPLAPQERKQKIQALKRRAQQQQTQQSQQQQQSSKREPINASDTGFGNMGSTTDTPGVGCTDNAGDQKRPSPAAVSITDSQFRESMCVLARNDKCKTKLRVALHPDHMTDEALLEHAKVGRTAMHL